MSWFTRAPTAIYDASLTIITALMWPAYASLVLAWTITLKPLVPLLGLEAHPEVASYLAWSSGGSLLLLLAATTLLRIVTRRFYPDLDAFPASADVAILRSGAKGFGPEWIVRIAYHIARRFEK